MACYTRSIRDTGPLRAKAQGLPAARSSAGVITHLRRPNRPTPATTQARPRTLSRPAHLTLLFHAGRGWCGAPDAKSAPELGR